VRGKYTAAIEKGLEMKPVSLKKVADELEVMGEGFAVYISTKSPLLMISNKGSNPIFNYLIASNPISRTSTPHTFPRKYIMLNSGLFGLKLPTAKRANIHY
jgi:hypothetical protein